MAGLYVHIPFCLKKCNYCDFCSFSGLSQETKSAYVAAVKRELASYRSSPKAQIETVFFGGGTPSLLSPREFSEICDAINESFDLSHLQEFSVEANPKTLTAASLAEYVTCGVNRVSIGLQSIHENELKKLGRIHNYVDFLNSYELVRSAGISNINVDLMYGIPDQTAESFSATLEAVEALGVPHLSVYGLIIEEGTPFARMRASLPLPSEDSEADMYYGAAAFLEDHGFRHYEISNYARSGYECKHNLKYWRAAEYIGVGVSAHSFYRGERYGNTSSLVDYISAAIPERNIDVGGNDERAFEFAMLSLRLADGLSFAEYEKRFGVDFRVGRTDKLAQFEKLGLLHVSNESVALTDSGFYVSNTILSELL